MTTELQPFAPEIWIAEGPTVPFFGFDYPTRMAVVRLRDFLWVWSPIELTDELEAAVRELGEVRWLVAPNKLHHLFLPAWLDTFDNAEAHAAPGLAEKRTDIDFAGTLGGEAPWGDEIDSVLIDGSRFVQEVVFFHRPSSTCLICDLLQRLDPDAHTGWRALAMKLNDLVGEDGSTPREWRATFLDRSRTARQLQAMLDWDPQRMIIAHGECAHEGAGGIIEQNLGWMRRSWPM